MVYFDESANCEILSKDAGFKILTMEKNPQTMEIKLIPITNGFNLRRKKEVARRTRDPTAKIPKGKSGKKFPAIIPVINDRVTGISGGNLKFSIFFTYSHLLSYLLVIEYAGYQPPGMKTFFLCLHIPCPCGRPGKSPWCLGQSVRLLPKRRLPEDQKP